MTDHAAHCWLVYADPWTRLRAYPHLPEVRVCCCCTELEHAAMGSPVPANDNGRPT